MKHLAFVAGATGYTGRHVVREVTSRGIATVAHVRPDSHDLEKWRNEFGAFAARIDSTPWDEAAMVETFRRLQPTIVFALLGTTRARINASADKTKTDYEAVDYGLTALLIRAAQKAQVAPRFVYLSAVGVKEGAKSPYYKARVKAEAELLASGLPYFIARPSFITGADREGRPSEKLAAGAIDGMLTFVGAIGAKGLRDRYLSLTGGQLAKALVVGALTEPFVDRICETGELREICESA